MIEADRLTQCIPPAIKPQKSTKRTGMFAASLWLLLVCFPGNVAGQTNYTLRSPNGRIEVRVHAADRLSYDVLLNGTPLLQNSTLSMKIDRTTIGVRPSVQAAKEQTMDQPIRAVVPTKAAVIRDHFNELRLECDGGYAVRFRAFNEGVAYRFEIMLPAAHVKVYDEDVSLKFAGDYNAYYPKEDSFFSHNEREFVNLALKSITPATLASVPAVVVANNDVKLAIAESDVEDYPGLWLRGTNGNALEATFPPYPLKQELRKNSDRDFAVTQTADYIAVVEGTRTFPWRIIGIAEHDADLIMNQMVYLLARSSQVADTSWIKPGKVAWDWYNANNIYGVDFKAGINTQTYKYYIDFASRYGLEYVILDEGWYKLGNLLEVVPDINVEELVAYGKQKRVGIILWVVWKTLDDQFYPAFEQAQKWGVKGFKVDFMQRDDQIVMNFYQKVCREAAERHMLVDFHGAIRPATMMRTWPNLVNVEGVRGLEQTKWSKYANPEHNVTLPFTRMLLGPMDYTPGAMVNSGRERNFAAIFERPMSLGTRVHQLAMYVVYEAPLQMLADSPSHYLREPEVMVFLKAVPTVWDETKVLAAKMGDYVCIARRRGRDWYIGAMTDWTGRTLDIDFSFLPAGQFELLSYEDGPNAERMGQDYKSSVRAVNRTTKLKITLASGGGWAAHLRAKGR
jgi:alpha-glucosidase